MSYDYAAATKVLKVLQEEETLKEEVQGTQDKLHASLHCLILAQQQFTQPSVLWDTEKCFLKTW